MQGPALSNYWPMLIGLLVGGAGGLGLALVFPELLPASEDERVNVVGLIASCVLGLFYGAGLGGLVGAAAKKAWAIRNAAPDDLGATPSTRARRWALAIPAGTALVLGVVWIAEASIHWPGADEWFAPWSLHAILFGAAGAFAVLALAAAGWARYRRQSLFSAVTVALSCLTAGATIDGYGMYQRKAIFYVGAVDPDLRVTIRRDDGTFMKVLQPQDRIRVPAGYYEVQVACDGYKEIRTVYLFGGGRPRVLGDGRDGGTFHLELTRDRNMSLSIEVAPKDDKERLQGRWVAISVDNGRQLPKELCAQFSLTFTGGKMKMRTFMPDASEAIFHLDETAKPKRIDIIDEDRKGQFGIYRFDGDCLAICVGEDDEKDRPIQFSSKGGNRRLVAIFKRATEPDAK
jgi:uncharacterized protein (TIGR03067 family)